MSKVNLFENPDLITALFDNDIETVRHYLQVNNITQVYYQQALSQNDPFSFFWSLHPDFLIVLGKALEKTEVTSVHCSELMDNVNSKIIAEFINKLKNTKVTSLSIRFPTNKESFAEIIPAFINTGVTSLRFSYMKHDIESMLDVEDMIKHFEKTPILKVEIPCNKELEQALNEQLYKMRIEAPFRLVDLVMLREEHHQPETASIEEKCRDLMQNPITQKTFAEAEHLEPGDKELFNATLTAHVISLPWTVAENIFGFFPGLNKTEKSSGYDWASSNAPHLYSAAAKIQTKRDSKAADVEDDKMSSSATNLV